MPLQRLLLRAMLWTLALAAGVGVLMIFVPGREITGRLFGTGILTAVAIALAMPVAKLLDVERLRPSGVLGLGVIVSAFATGLMGIWIGLLGSNIDEKLWLTALALAGCGIAACAMVALLGTPVARIGGRLGLACAIAAFLSLLCAIWGRLIGLDSWSDEFGESVLYLAPIGTLAVACLIGVGVDRVSWRLVCGLGAAAAAAAFAMGMISVWVKPGGDATWFAECIIVAVVVAHANLVTRIPLPAAQRWLAWGAVAGMLATAVCMTVINVTTAGFDLSVTNDLLARVAAACGIVTGCATLALIVLNRFNRRTGPVASGPVTEFTSVLLACPRCRTKQTAPVGTSGCTGCGLLLTVRVSEPHCPACDYVTLDLTGDTCPECGGKLFPRGVPIPPPSPLGEGLTMSARV